ncbi:hypothetical protein ADK38_16840 [Streptomyces varsoviensis]|uniref:Uncharacterized protein n=1 Tax=Streptomyces varsoviensis TaxID=67373 RepID=A0ABR5J6C3_9ACTN|nr:hypothetical protein ADK38_16840 [Streptomyces varsoviensis]
MVSAEVRRSEAMPEVAESDQPGPLPEVPPGGRGPGAAATFGPALNPGWCVSVLSPVYVVLVSARVLAPSPAPGSKVTTCAWPRSTLACRDRVASRPPTAVVWSCRGGSVNLSRTIRGNAAASTSSETLL